MHRFFTGPIFCDFSTEFSPCKIHRFFHRLFLCHMLFHRFFTGSHPIVMDGVSVGDGVSVTIKIVFCWSQLYERSRY